ncbi:MAG TPA: hypothetical protein VFI95_16470 [Terriglobales bacterium]|nr:hypothetical protein [Terriglobales bacterium]
MKKRKDTQRSRGHFPLVPLTDANRRNGKHHKIVSDILSDLAKLDQYSAIKIDLAAAGKNKAALRAALLRAAQKRKIPLSTSSDERHLYVFRSLPRKPLREMGYSNSKV